MRQYFTAIVAALALVAFPRIASAEEGKGWNGFGGGILPAAEWHPYALSSPFNTPATGAKEVTNSEAYVHQALSSGTTPVDALSVGGAETEDYAHPTFWAQPGDSLYTLHRTESGDDNINGTKIPIPTYARPAGGSDKHMAVITPEGWEYDFWHAAKSGETLNYGFGGRTRIDGEGLESGATASGVGNLAGIIRGPEFVAGKINHALFITLRCTAKSANFGYGTISDGSTAYIYPADRPDGFPCSSDTNALPLGARVKLELSDPQIAALPVPSWKKTILTALAHYGGYVGDTGGGGSFGMAFEFESPLTYTTLGKADPILKYAEEHINDAGSEIVKNSKTTPPTYSFIMNSGVEWEKDLRVLQPRSSPHWYQNNVRLAEGAPENGRSVMAWGSVTLENAKIGSFTCLTLGGGDLANPVGGGAGKGVLEGVTFYDCQAPTCEAAKGLLEVIPEKLEWSSVLIEEPSVFRDRTEGIALREICVGGATNVEFHGMLKPQVEGGTMIGFPAHLAFGAVSGSLQSGEGAGNVSARLKLMGFEGGEMLRAKNP
jgi:hypothetical protein